jgi:hypothetical protein
MRALSDLRDYQQRAVTRLFESDGVMLVLPMGSGKTAIAELQEFEPARHALVLAPKRVAHLVWPKEVKEWEHLVGVDVRVADGSETQRRLVLSAHDEHDITVVGIDNTIWLCNLLAALPDDHPLFDLLIIDEISRFRNPKSKRGKALLSIIKRFKSVWGLTGTPRPNGLEDLYKPLQIVTKSAIWGRSFYAWRQQRFYPADRNGYDWLPLPGQEARILREASPYMLALAPEDMPSLPPVTVVEHTVHLPEEVLDSYRKMQRELFAEINGREVLAASAGVASGKLAQIAQGFMYAEGGNTDVEEVHREKANWIAELVEGLAGDPLIIVYEFVEDLRTLQRLFGKDLPYLGQGVSDAMAAKHVEAWNAGKLPLFALHAASGGHGLNLQSGGCQMAWYGLTWSPELYDQTVARIVRPGQAGHVFVHLCLASGTVDELKRLRVVAKLSAQEAFAVYLKTI